MGQNVDNSPIANSEEQRIIVDKSEREFLQKQLQLVLNVKAQLGQQEKQLRERLDKIDRK